MYEINMYKIYISIERQNEYETFTRYLCSVRVINVSRYYICKYMTYDNLHMKLLPAIIGLGCR